MLTYLLIMILLISFCLSAFKSESVLENFKRILKSRSKSALIFDILCIGILLIFIFYQVTNLKTYTLEFSKDNIEKYSQYTLLALIGFNLFSFFFSIPSDQLFAKKLEKLKNKHGKDYYNEIANDLEKAKKGELSNLDLKQIREKHRNRKKNS